MASVLAPFRDELLGIERLEERALSLAALLNVDTHTRRRARSIFPRFDDNTRALRHAYSELAADVHAGRFVTAAAEWLGVPVDPLAIPLAGNGCPDTVRIRLGHRLA